MANPLVVLNDPATVVAQFNAILAKKQNSLFVVLGSGATLQNYANQAATFATDFRLAVQVTSVGSVYPVLKTLATENGNLPADPTGVTAVAIAPNQTICQILTDTNPNNIIPAFLLADTP